MKTTATPVDTGELALGRRRRARFGSGSPTATCSSSSRTPASSRSPRTGRSGAHTRTEHVRIQEFPPTSRDGEEPTDAVAAAMSQASATFELVDFSVAAEDLWAP
jgi:hypothetical protein